MDSIFNKWRTRVPQYRNMYHPLFEFLARKGGGSEEGREDQGKSFSNYYELYIYAFFLGLYNDEKIPIEDDQPKIKFGQPIQYWGNMKAIGRKNYSGIQEYIFSGLIANSDIDLLKLENADEQEIEKSVRNLIIDMEEYTNGGFNLLQEKYDNNKAFFYNKEVFVDMILPNQNRKSEWN